MRTLQEFAKSSPRRERRITPSATLLTLFAMSAVLPGCASMSNDPNAGEKDQLIFLGHAGDPVVDVPWLLFMSHYEDQAACPPAPGSNCRPTEDPITVVSARCDDDACITTIRDDSALFVRAKRAGQLRVTVVARRTDTGQTYEDARAFVATKADRFELAYDPGEDVSGAFMAVGARTSWAIKLFAGSRELAFDMPPTAEVFTADPPGIVEFVESGHADMRTMNVLSRGSAHVVARLGGLAQELDVRAEDTANMVDVELVEPRAALVTKGGPCESAQECPRESAVEYRTLSAPLSVSSLKNGILALGRDASGLKYALPWSVVEVTGGSLLEREYAPTSSAGATVFHVAAGAAPGGLTVRVGGAHVYALVP